MYFRLCRDAFFFTAGTFSVLGFLLTIDEVHQRFNINTDHPGLFGWMISLIIVIVIVFVLYALTKIGLYFDIIKNTSRTTSVKTHDCSISNASRRRARFCKTILKRP